MREVKPQYIKLKPQNKPTIKSKSSINKPKMATFKSKNKPKMFSKESILNDIVKIYGKYQRCCAATISNGVVVYSCVAR